MTLTSYVPRWGKMKRKVLVGPNDFTVMKLPTLIFFAMIAVLLAGCRSSKAPPDGDLSMRSQVASEAKKVLEAQAAAWNRGDIPGFMEGYWKSPQLIFTSGGRIRRGFQAALEGYMKGYTKETMGHLVFSDLDVTPLCADALVVLGHWRIEEVKEPSGGVFTLVMRRFPEGWRVIHDHTSVHDDKNE